MNDFLKPHLIARLFRLPEPRVVEALDAMREFRRRGGHVVRVVKSNPLPWSGYDVSYVIPGVYRIQSAPSAAPSADIAPLDVAVHMLKQLEQEGDNGRKTARNRPSDGR